MNITSSEIMTEYIITSICKSNNINYYEYQKELENRMNKLRDKNYSKVKGELVFTFTDDEIAVEYKVRGIK